MLLHTKAKGNKIKCIWSDKSDYVMILKHLKRTFHVCTTNLIWELCTFLYFEIINKQVKMIYNLRLYFDPVRCVNQCFVLYNIG